MDPMVRGLSPHQTSLRNQWDTTPGPKVGSAAFNLLGITAVTWRKKDSHIAPLGALGRYSDQVFAETSGKMNQNDTK